MLVATGPTLGPKARPTGGKVVLNLPFSSRTLVSKEEQLIKRMVSGHVGVVNGSEGASSSVFHRHLVHEPVVVDHAEGQYLYLQDGQ